MYGNENIDPVVKYYDITVGSTGEDELNWYKNKVKQFGGPILDLACGTGRMTIEFAKDNYNIIGIDISESMLSIFKKKLDSYSEEIQNRIEIHQNQMTDFQFDVKFNVILCIDAFFHNLSVEDEMHCLNCVSQHLTTTGRFFFNVHNPTDEFLNFCKASKGQKWVERGRYWINNQTERIIISQASDIDINKQLIFTKLKFEKFDMQQNLLSTEFGEWTTRYNDLPSYKKLIEKSGLIIEEVVGNYKNEPVSAKSQLIFQIKKKGFRKD